MTIKINNERPMILGGPELKRRLALRRIGALAGLTAFGGTSALLSGCGGGGGGTSPPLAAPPQAISPSLGAHELASESAGVGVDPTIVALDTPTSSGSTILVCVGRGQISRACSRQRTTWPIPTRCWKGHTFTAPNGRFRVRPSMQLVGVRGEIMKSARPIPITDEITVAVVEILNGGVIEDHSWRYDRLRTHSNK